MDAEARTPSGAGRPEPVAFAGGRPSRRPAEPRERLDAVGAGAAGATSGRGEPVAFAAGRPSPPADLERRQRFAWRWIGAAAVMVTLFVGYQLLLVVQTWVGALLHTLLYIVFGAVLAFIVTPLVDRMERHLHVPRTAAALLALLLEVAVVVALGYVISGPLTAEARSLASHVPALIQQGQSFVGQVQARLGGIGIHVANGGSPLGDNGSNLISSAGSAVLTAVTKGISVAADVVITLVTAFWLLRDGSTLRIGLVSMLPGRVRDGAEFTLDAVAVVIGGYVRGQLLMAFLIGALAWAGCLALGVPYPIVVGVAAGVFELVPLVGPFVGGAVATLLALTVSPVLALYTVLLFLVIHAIEGYVVSPRVQAKFVQLHPLVAFLALVAGIEVDGFLGALFAVPAASLGAVLLRAALGDWRERRPDLFAPVKSDPAVQRRRRTLLSTFRLFEERPSRMVAGWYARARRSRALRHAVPVVIGIAAVVALVMAVQPGRLAAAMARFHLLYIPALVALALSYYVLQGVRWHMLLRAEDVSISWRDTLLLNMAGQSTSMLPLGELTRGIFVSEATGAPLGRVTACITVQELIYSLFLIAIAVRGAFQFPVAGAMVVLALLGTAMVFVILTVPPVFRLVRRVVEHVPLVKRLLPAVDQLQRDTSDLLRRRTTYTTAWISLLQAGIAITLFWLSAQSLQPGVASWTTMSFVYAVIGVASAISLSPGGLGAFELGAAGLLLAAGLPFDIAGATAIVHRLADKGVGTLVGFATYAVARRRFGFADIRLLGLRQDERGRSVGGRPVEDGEVAAR